MATKSSGKTTGKAASQARNSARVSRNTAATTAKKTPAAPTSAQRQQLSGIKDKLVSLQSRLTAATQKTTPTVPPPTQMQGAAGAGATGVTGQPDTSTIRSNYGLPDYKSESNYYGSSDQVRQQESETRDYISGLYSTVNDQYNSTVSRLNNMRNSTQDLYLDRMDQLNSQGRAEIGGLNAQYDTARTRLQDSQKKEGAEFNTGLVKLGGYLGGSASAMGAVADLNREFNFEVLQLEEKRSEAIRLAQEGIMKGQFDLAEAAAQSAMQAEQAIQQRQDAFFSQSFNLMQEKRIRDTDERDFAVKTAERNIDFMVASGETPSDEDIFNTARSLRISPQTLETAVSAKQASQKLLEAREQGKYEMEVLRTLSDIPAGRYVSIGGKTYSGLKPPPQASETQIANGLKAQFMMDYSNGMTRADALKKYGASISLDYVKNVYEMGAGALIQDRIDKGEVMTAKIGDKDYYVDRNKAQVALGIAQTNREMNGWWSNLLTDDEEITFDGKTYTVPAGSWDINDYIVGGAGGENTLDYSVND